MRRIEIKRLTVTKFGIAIMFKESEVLRNGEILVVEVQKILGKPMQDIDIYIIEKEKK